MKWLDVHIGGQKWRIDLVRGDNKHLRPKGERRLGTALYGDCRIYLAREQSEQSLEDTFLHELIHALFAVTGVDVKLADALAATPDPNNEDAAHELEETVVRALTPTLHRLLKDLGFKFPKPPTKDVAA